MRLRGHGTPAFLKAMKQGTLCLRLWLSLLRLQAARLHSGRDSSCFHLNPFWSLLELVSKSVSD